LCSKKYKLNGQIYQKNKKADSFLKEPLIEKILEDDKSSEFIEDCKENPPEKTVMQ